mmetsp:Transcript_42254/g.64769  ORF Transcript_42254/g.64769 Transcript_42254/m.64769 type:complete len:111 (+) Transcript_42254:2091-2423(+)
MNGEYDGNIVNINDDGGVAGGGSYKLPLKRNKTAGHTTRPKKRKNLSKKPMAGPQSGLLVGQGVAHHQVPFANEFTKSQPEMNQQDPPGLGSLGDRVSMGVPNILGGNPD